LAIDLHAAFNLLIDQIAANNNKVISQK